MKPQDREFEIDWIMLNTKQSFNRQYYENKTDEEIEREYNLLLSEEYQEQDF